MALVDEGLQFLEALAVQYEQTARQIRATIAAVGALERGRSALPAINGEELVVSEACRRVLAADRSRPLKPREVHDRIKAQGVRLRTSSDNLPNLVQSTLYAMEKQGHVRAVRDRGELVGYELNL